MQGRKHEGRAALATLALFVVLVAANSATRKGGVLDDPILDPGNRYHQMAERIAAQYPEFSGEAVFFILSYPEGVTESSISEVAAFHKKIEERFPSASVISIGSYPNFRDDGTTVTSYRYGEPFENPTFSESGRFSVSRWQEEVRGDPGVYGILVDRDLTAAYIVLRPASGYDEMALYRAVASFVEERDIPESEWMSKHDIYPKNPHLYVAGGIVGRGVVDGMANFENTSRTVPGVLLAFLVLLLTLRSVRQALLSIALIVATMLAARGTIGALDIAGFGSRERVFSSLVLANVLVQGASFALRLFEGWNEAWARDPNRSYREVWREVLAERRGVVALVALVSAANFVVIAITTEVRALYEVGLLSALAIGYLYLAASFGLPAIHSAIGGVPKNGAGRVGRAMSLLSSLLERSLDATVRQAARWTSKTSKRGPALAFGVAGFIALAGSLAWQAGFVEVGSREMEYTRGTHIERANEFMGAPHRAGFATMDIVVEPPASERHDAGAYLDPTFLNAAWRFSREIRGEQTGVREVGSVLSALDRISAESFPGRSRETGIVTSRGEAAAYFTYITSGIDRKVLDEIYSENAYRLTVSFPAEGSAYTRRLQEGVEAIAKAYPELSVTLGGRMALYPSVDHYLEEAQLWNFLFGDLVIILGITVFFWIGRRSATRAALHPLRAGICLALPFTVSSATIMLVMAFCRVPLDMATAAIGAICLNASIDFSLYLLFAYERAVDRHGRASAGAQAVTKEGKVVLTDALVNTACFLPLVGSLFLPIERLGLLVVVMLWASACSAIFLMPLALEWAARAAEPVSARQGEVE